MIYIFLGLIFWAVPLQAAIVDLDTVIVEATRSQDQLGDIARPVTIITREDIQRSAGKSIPEILGTKEGIHGVQYGNIKNAQVDIRGFGENGATNVLVLVNGRRTNQIDLSGQDWAQIDINSIERIEVIRGGATVLYGDNAVGGVINIITKKGQKDSKPNIVLSSEWGHFQSAKQGFELNGGLEKAEYQINFGHDQSGGYRANSNYWANDLNSRFGFELSDMLGIDLAQGYHLDRYHLPGALFLNNVAQYGRSGVRPSQNNDRGWTSDAHYDVMPRMKFQAGASEGEFSILGTARKRSNKFFTGSTVYETMYLTNTYEAQPKIVMTTPVNDRVTHKATAGYDYFYAKGMRRSGNLGPSQDLVYISKITHGGYWISELDLDERWLASAGVRGAWADYVFDQKRVVTGYSERSPSTQGYEGSVGYKYHPRSKAYVNYTRSYRLPAVDEFYQNLYDFGGGFSGGGLNTALEEQIGNQIEIGLQDNSIDHFKAGMNFYTARYKGEIYLDPATFVNTNYNGRTHHYGFESNAEIELFDGQLRPFANWTIQEALFSGGSYGGKHIPFVPEQMYTAGMHYSPIKRVTATLTMNHTGERFAVSDVNNTHAKLKSFTTIDLGLDYAHEDFDLWLALRNLADKTYMAYGVYSVFSDDIGYYPAPGRNVSAGMKVKF